MAKLLIQLHLVAFRLISRTLILCLLPVNHLPVVTRRLTKGFTLILSFSPQGRRDLTAFAGTTVAPPPRVRSAVAHAGFQPSLA